MAFMRFVAISISSPKNECTFLDNTGGLMLGGFHVIDSTDYATEGISPNLYCNR